MTVRTRVLVLTVLVSLVGGFLIKSIASGTRETLLVATQIEPICFDIEVADTWLARARGLMFRDTLAEHQGMLFRYDGETPVTFWMKNVDFSLDIIFISSSGHVTKIHENAMPDDTTPIHSDAPVSLVLEVRGGTSRRAQITLGDRVAQIVSDNRQASMCQSRSAL